ncbi:MAG: beta-aspartyl-peptidase [Neisseriaceae bacterium]|nr:beta-aspartyl-peptidase [Neisseriaceae bacterium]
MNALSSLSLRFTLLQGAEVFAPEALGIQDVLLCGQKIVAIEPNIDAQSIPHCTVINLSGHKLCPGLIDQHIHLIGGGGEAGPHTRTPEANLSALVEAGITTAVGLLGTDGITRHPASLLAKVKALNHEGISAYMFTGAYTVPTPTITGSIEQDVAFIDPIIGVKTAVSDHRSSAPTAAELARLSSQARVGGLLGSKAGITVLHLGNSSKTLAPLYELLDASDLPINKLLPTHINRTQILFEAAIAFALKGGTIDITSGIDPDIGARNAVKPSHAITQALAAGVPMHRLTISSDGNGSMPKFDEQGQLVGITIAGFGSLMKALRNLVQEEQLPLAEALRPFTSSVADLLQLAHKGRIQTDADADLLILDQDLQLQAVFAKGQQMVAAGKAIVKGTFEA